MGTPESSQSSFDSLAPMVHRGRGAEALRRDDAHDRQRVFDAVMQFLDDQRLKFIRGLTLLRIDAHLKDQRLGIEVGLFQQKPQTLILRGQRLRLCLGDWRTWLGNNRQGARTNHVPQLSDHLLDLERLTKEAAFHRLVRIRYIDLTGHQNDFDGWPAVMHRVRELQSVYAARHLNVRKKQRDVGTRLKNG